MLQVVAASHDMALTLPVGMCLVTGAQQASGLVGLWHTSV